MPYDEVVDGELLDDECEGGYTGCEGIGVWQVDPYALESDDEEVYMVLCENCAYGRAIDV